MKAHIWKDRDGSGWRSHVPQTSAWMAVDGFYWPTWKSAMSHVLTELDRRRRHPGGPGT